MDKHSDEWILKKYLSCAPVVLALIRSIDCRYFSGVKLEGRILDLGCGDGMFTNILFRGARDKVIAGIDSNLIELKKAQKSNTYKYLVDGNITNMPFQSNYYDAVISNSVLEHVQDVDLALKEISRILKNDGYLVFTVPSPYLSQHMFFPAVIRRIGLISLATKYSAFKNKVWQHLHIYPPQVWIDKLNAHHLRTIRFNYIHPQAVTRICDIFTFFGAMSLLWRKVFNRLLLFPGNFRGWLFAKFFRHLYYLESTEGSTIFIIARKQGRYDTDKKIV